MSIFKKLSIKVFVFLALATIILSFTTNIHAAVIAPNNPQYYLDTCRYEGSFAANGNYTTSGSAIPATKFPACTSVDVGALGFQIPTLGDILTFVIRAFFVIAGLAALFFMLLGAFAWVTSGGDSEAVGAAQGKIQAAVVGMLIIVGVLAIIWTLEQVIFNRRICLGLSCPLTLPGLLESKPGKNCCVCKKEDGTNGPVINTYGRRCLDEFPYSAPIN